MFQIRASVRDVLFKNVFLIGIHFVPQDIFYSLEKNLLFEFFCWDSDCYMPLMRSVATHLQCGRSFSQRIHEDSSATDGARKGIPKDGLITALRRRRWLPAATPVGHVFSKHCLRLVWCTNRCFRLFSDGFLGPFLEGSNIGSQSPAIGLWF